MLELDVIKKGQKKVKKKKKAKKKVKKKKRNRSTTSNDRALYPSDLDCLIDDSYNPEIEF